MIDYIFGYENLRNIFLIRKIRQGKQRFPLSQILHIRVVRPTTTFRGHPSDVLRWIFDVTGLTVHTVRSIDLKTL